MSRRPIHATSTHLLAMFLLAALLCAQWNGWQHRIAHANWQQATLSTLSGSGPHADWDNKAQHACAAFDAAHLADSVAHHPCPAALPPNTHVLALWLAFISWDAPFSRHFSSRAPPA